MITNSKDRGQFFDVLELESDTRIERNKVLTEAVSWTNESGIKLR